MQYSVLTRGFSSNADYKWSSSPAESLEGYLGGNEPFGIVVSRTEDGMFSIYMMSEGSQKTDYQQRKIRIGFLITDCNEAKMKGLVAWALAHWDGYVEQFIKFCNDFGTDEWTINLDAIKQFTNSVPEIPSSGTLFEKRYERANTADNRTALLEELKQFDFSPTAGLKLIVDNFVLSGTEKLQTVRSQVERYLAKNATAKEWNMPKVKCSMFSLADFPLLIGTLVKKIPPVARPYIIAVVCVVFGFLLGAFFGRSDIIIASPDETVALEQQIAEKNKEIEALKSLPIEVDHGAEFDKLQKQLDELQKVLVELIEKRFPVVETP